MVGRYTGNLLKWGANPNHATAALHIKIGVKSARDGEGGYTGYLTTTSRY